MFLLGLQAQVKSMLAARVAWVGAVGGCGEIAR